MSKFKVGDLVILTESGINEWHKCNRNPINTRGCITGFHGGWIDVAWDNGTENGYHESDLNHYGLTLAELNVKAGDVVEMLTKSHKGYLGSICKINAAGYAVSKEGRKFNPAADKDFERTWRIISRASDTPNWLPCPADYKPQDNHEVTYHMGVPTHYYVTEPVMVDSVRELVTSDGEYYTAKGKTRDGKPVGQWTIDMDAD